MITFTSWPNNTVIVREVQTVTVQSNCSSQLCSSTFYSLGYEAAMTGNLFTVNEYLWCAFAIAIKPSHLFKICTFRSNSSWCLSSCGGGGVERPLVDSTWHGPGHKRGRQSRISLHGHIQFWQRYKGCLHLLLFKEKPQWGRDFFFLPFMGSSLCNYLVWAKSTSGFGLKYFTCQSSDANCCEGRMFMQCWSSVHCWLCDSCHQASQRSTRLEKQCLTLSCTLQ